MVFLSLRLPQTIHTFGACTQQKGRHSPLPCISCTLSSSIWQSKGRRQGWILERWIFKGEILENPHSQPLHSSYWWFKPWLRRVRLGWYTQFHPCRCHGRKKPHFCDLWSILYLSIFEISDGRKDKQHLAYIILCYTCGLRIYGVFFDR